jgi:hypothetical protein
LAMRKSSDSTTRTRIRRLSPVVLFALHQLIATIGVIVISGVVFDAVFGLLHAAISSTIGIRASWLLTELPGFPVQILLGIALGFLLARASLSRAALWVWVLPFLFLCFGAAFVVHPVGSISAHLFGSACKPVEHCFDQFLFTLPFLASLAYTAGAALARSRSPRERVGRFPTTAP